MEDAIAKVSAAAAGLGGGAARARAASEARAAVRGGGAAAVAWRSKGGLPPLVRLVRLLHKRANNSSDVALGHSLSALADCCLDPDSRRQAGQLLAEEPALAALRRAINNPDKMTRFDDDLAGRACRLLANLAGDPKNAETLNAKGAVSSLTKTVEREETSQSTLLMALRAIRLLWTNESLRDDMLKSGIVKSVSVLFSKKCMAAQIVDSKGYRRVDPDGVSRKKFGDLFAGILKCIGTFTLHPVDECASQILGDGLGYRCLISLMEDYQSTVVQCIVNLCYVPKMRPSLGNAGAVKCLINLIKSNPDYPFKWIIALRLLCRVSNNSAKCKKYGGLTMLMSLIKNSSSLKSQFYTIQTLYCFIYDEDALAILAKEGFIDVIAQLIKDHVDLMNCGHQASNPDLSKCDRNKKLSTGTNDPATSDNESIDSCNRDILEEKFQNNHLYEDTYSLLEVSPHKKSKLDWSPKEKNQESKVENWKKNQTPYISPYSDSSIANNYSPDFRESKNKKHVYSNSAIDTGNTYYYSARSPESTSSSVDGYISAYGNSSLWSPESPGMSYSPSSASYCDNDSMDSELSGRYSPVCSDSDEDDCLNLKYDEETISNNELKNENEDKLQGTPKIENDDVSSDQMETQKIKYLMIFLSQYTNQPKNNGHLFSSQDLLYILVSYIEKSKYPINRAGKALSRIISNAANFKYILKQTFILHLITAIHKPKHSRCKQCKQVQKIYGKFLTQISVVAETDFGIGEITYHLSKADITIKEKTAASIPHIIKSTRALKKFLIDYNGLELFLNSFEKHPLEICVSSLTKLATTLEIRAPKPIYPSFKDCAYPDYAPDFDKNDEIIFVLDDSSVVEADQQLLCKHSDVFVAMLHGVFIEGLQKRVRLQKVTKGGLEYLLILLKAEINAKSNDTFPLPKTLGDALEALLLADRFLIDNIKNCLFSAIVQFKLDFTTAHEIYVWSLEEGMGTLCMESVAYTLAGQISDEKKCKIISAIMSTIYKDQWLEDVRSSLLRFL